MNETLVELSRDGRSDNPLEFLLSDITTHSVASAFQVSHFRRDFILYVQNNTQSFVVFFFNLYSSIPRRFGLGKKWDGAASFRTSMGDSIWTRRRYRGCSD